jgi:zinc D-Ala-D-Ala carboxypeptidase
VTSTRPARRTTRHIRIRRLPVAGLLIVIAALAAALGAHSPLSSPAPVSSPSTATSPSAGAPPIDRRRGERHRPLGEADGAVPDGTTVFDDDVPGVANLDADLAGALRRAATDAGGDGVELHVDSGWRSRAYQEQLLREAIAKYGSEAEATRWVATPDTSAHVSGDAVDIGPSGAAAWLSEHGAAYGLCRIYRNEPWHYELRPDAADHGCPPAYADPTDDPRMHQ